MELTGTNRSNPPDPSLPRPPGQPETRPRAAASAPSGAAPPACSPPRPARPKLVRSRRQDASSSRHFPVTFANPARQAPGSSHGSTPWTKNPPGVRFGQTALWRAGPRGGLAGLVATARGQTPDPIPNSAVKTLSADGTAAQAAEEQVAARPAKPPARAQLATPPLPAAPGKSPAWPPPARQTPSPHPLRATPTAGPAVTGPQIQSPPDPITGAGWSSPVARQAHNLKVVGSNPTPATKPIS